MASRPRAGKSDNLIHVKKLSATEVSRNFSRVLDRIESGQESFIVVRNGRTVAQIGPAASSSGRRVKDLLARYPRDRAWARDLAKLRALLTVEEPPWTG